MNARMSISWGALVVVLGMMAGCERDPDSTTDSQSTGDGDPAVEAAAIADASGDCSLTMGWDPWEPYQYTDVDGNVRGLDVELVSAISSGAGCDLDFVERDWKTLLRMLQTGEVDFMPGATMTEKRLKFALFSEPYRTESFILYVAAGDDRDRDATFREMLQDGFRVGITEGYYYGEAIAELQDDDRITDQFSAVQFGESNFERLNNGEIDGFLEDPVVAAAIMRRKGFEEQIEAHTIRITSGDVRLMFSRASVNPDVVERLNLSLANLKSEGRYDQILAKWGN